MAGRPPLEPRISALEAKVADMEAKLAIINEQLAQQPQNSQRVYSPQEYQPVFSHWPNQR